MIVGRIAPQAQTTLKRLLAYSSIGHMGLLLMPLCSESIENNFLSPNLQRGSFDSASGLVFSSSPNRRLGVLWAYMILYIFINLGVWGLLMQESYRPGEKKYTGPQYLWDLKGLKRSSPRAAFRWAVLMISLAGIPPVYAFQGKAAILWQSVNSEVFTLVFVALRYSQIGSVYYLKVIKICYVDTPTNWRTYGRFSTVSAYIIRRSVFIMLLGQWYSNVLFQYTHTLALQLSNLCFSFFFKNISFRCSPFC